MSEKSMEEWNIVPGAESDLTMHSNIKSPLENEPNIKSERKPETQKEEEEDWDFFDFSLSNMLVDIRNYFNTEIERLKTPTCKSLADCVDRIDNILDHSKDLLRKFRERLVE